MVTIEQVELLEIKVSKAIEYVRRLSAENERLRGETARFASENNLLYTKLDSYQTRISELEVMLQGFKKDQERIEQGIISALDRLNHFEDAVGGTESAPDTGGTGMTLPPETGGVADAVTNAAVDADDPVDTDLGDGPALGDSAVDMDMAAATDDALDILHQGDAPPAITAGMETGAVTGGEAGDGWSLEGNSEKPQQNAELDIF